MKRIMLILAVFVLFCACTTDTQYNHVGQKLQYPEVSENESVNQAINHINAMKIQAGEQKKSFEIKGACCENNLLKLREAMRTLETQQYKYNKDVTDDNLKSKILFDFDFSKMTGMTTFDDSFFQGCDLLHSVVMPDECTFVGRELFCYCMNLESITLGNNVTEIGYCAFGKTSIKTIVIPAKMRILGSEVFFDCGKLQNVIFKTDKIDKLGNFCFGNCKDINFIVESESDKITVTEIGTKNPFCGVNRKFPFSEVETHYSDNDKKYTSKLYYSSKMDNALLQDYSVEVTSSDNTNDSRKYSATILINYPTDESGDVRITGIQAGTDYQIITSFFADINDNISGVNTPPNKTWWRTDTLSDAMMKKNGLEVIDINDGLKQYPRQYFFMKDNTDDEQGGE